MGEPTIVNLDPEFEWGLRLPDGKVVWPPSRFYGSDFQTEEERAGITKAIVDAIANMSLPLQTTLATYSWLRRERQTIIVERFQAYDMQVADTVSVQTSEAFDDEPPTRDAVPTGKGYVQS